MPVERVELSIPKAPASKTGTYPSSVTPAVGGHPGLEPESTGSQPVRLPISVMPTCFNTKGKLPVERLELSIPEGHCS